jgi:hydrogenase nickel incorporation protein HypB
MCLTCGCGSGETHVEGADHVHVHTHADGTTHAHTHTHNHLHGYPHHGHGTTDRIAGAASDVSQVRLVQIERDILAKNDALANANRDWLAERGIFALNLVSSPGSGKTTLLVRTIEQLAAELPISVIEGDQQTLLDAERIRATGAPALQINTGKGCHLDAAMVQAALPRLAPAEDSVLMIENVGNLVCPAGFDLGEQRKVVVVSVTEGEDKPLKYPDMFSVADLVLVNKVDLLPYLKFDLQLLETNLRRLKPGVPVMRVSATTGEGFEPWLKWLLDGVRSRSVEAAAAAETSEAAQRARRDEPANTASAKAVLR